MSVLHISQSSVAKALWKNVQLSLRYKFSAACACENFV